MYPSIEYTRQQIIDIAKEDLEGYIDSMPLYSNLRDYCLRAKEEIRQTTRVQKFETVQGTARFIETHLDWLEMKYPRHQLFPVQSDFMAILEGWIARMTRSRDEGLKKLKEAPRAPQLLNYANYIVQRELGDDWSLRVLSAKQSQFDLQGFPSFLLIASGMNMVSIVLDEKRLEAGRSVHAHEKRYEMCLLHEIAHFRLHRDYILRIQDMENLEKVRVRPAHEVDAWLYAGTITMYLDSLRARISRLLAEKDEQGLLYH